ncbi:hypothetical protein QYF36_014396 [Acer negundo]|nr:hypothetical protein QYF36_014396 [Acer negundo]
MSSTTANSRSAMEFSQKVSDWRCMGDAGVGDDDAFSRGGPELPVNIITKWLKGRSPSLVVADFGCGFVNGMMGGVVGFREEFHLSELQESEKILGNEKICRVCGVFWVVYVKPLIFITTEPANGPMNL